MKPNPVLNALGATAYIGLVVLFLRFIESIRSDTPDTYLDGMGFISLFIFSAAIMAFLFFYQPIILLFENKKTEALSYFFRTLGIFGIITTTLLTLVSLS